MGKAMSVPILTYFQFRGLGESIRLLLEDQGIVFEDRRVAFGPEWEALKPELPFGQVPRLQVGDRTIVQSQAILRHLGREHGLCGATEADRVRCDVSLEAARDGSQRLVDHFWSPDSMKPGAPTAFETGTLADLLAMLERWLGDAPWFGGGEVLIADYYVLTVLDEAAIFFPAAMERAPALAAYRRRMNERPGIAAYIASGRQSEFTGFDPYRGIRGVNTARAA
jgi:glutathione S-transferase